MKNLYNAIDFNLGMGKQTKKNIIAVIGVICIVTGFMGGIPTILQGMFGLAIGATILVIVGVILLAIAFGD